MSTDQTTRDLILSVVYVSSAVTLLSDDELIGLLRVSRTNNTREQITGMLLYKDGNFMQVLEGPETGVRNRLEIIRQDSHHSGILRLIERRQPERDFTQWSMGFRNLKELSDEDQKAHNAFYPSSLLDHRFRDTPATAYTLLRSFKEKM